jgi:hypothetical protein
MKKNASFETKSSDWIGMWLKSSCVNLPAPAQESREIPVPGTGKNS